MEKERTARPGELEETPDEDVPQDPGVPGVKLPADEPELENARPQIHVVLNWFEELKSRVPAR